MGIKLNLGSGQKPLEGFINVDFIKRRGVDVVHNLENFPYPFKDNSVDYVMMDNSLEHLEDTIRVMEELHRICKPNAIIEIFVPHYSSAGAFSSLTHKRFFGSQSFNDLTDESWSKYSSIKFKILQNKLEWFSCRDWFWIRPIKFIIDKIINIRPFWAERFFCYTIGGFDSIHFKLQVKKSFKSYNKSL